MFLDLRIPIGCLFLVLGVLLGSYGLLSDRALYTVSLGINVNVWWGAVMIAFGGSMLGFGLRGTRHSS